MAAGGLAGGRARRAGREARTFRIFFALLVFVTKATPPPAAASIPTDFVFARPEYFHELMPARLLGSVVKCGPILPIWLRPGTFRFCRKHELSFTICHTSSAEAMATGLPVGAGFVEESGVVLVRSCIRPVRLCTGPPRRLQAAVGGSIASLAPRRTR